MLDRALAMWRGEPFLELESELAHAGRVRLDELRLRAIEERIEIQLSRGAAAEVIGDLEAQALANPTRERVHAQLARALTATGRAVDAMQVFDRFRRTLGDELGIEPSPQFRALNDEIITGTLPLERAELETTRSRACRVTRRRSSAGKPRSTTSCGWRRASDSSRCSERAGWARRGSPPKRLCVSTRCSTATSSGATWRRARPPTCSRPSAPSSVSKPTPASGWSIGSCRLSGTPRACSCSTTASTSSSRRRCCRNGSCPAPTPSISSRPAASGSPSMVNICSSSNRCRWARAMHVRRSICSSNGRPPPVPTSDTTRRRDRCCRRCATTSGACHWRSSWPPPSSTRWTST